MNRYSSPRLPRLGAWLAALLLATPSLVTANEIPSGSLSPDRRFVKSGEYAKLSWNIGYPLRLENLVEIRPPFVIRPLRNLRMDVRIVGASFNAGKTNHGHGNNEDGVDSSNPSQSSGGPNGAYDMSQGFDDETRDPKKTYYLPVQFLWARNGEARNQLFYGTQKNIDPSRVVMTAAVNHTESINFAARGWRKVWLPLYSTANTTPNVVVLRNGDAVASAASVVAKRNSVENFLKPYFSADGKTVKIGPKDLLLLFELGSPNPNARDFDLQDIAVLLTFTES
jgi:hypothetical protein